MFRILSLGLDPGAQAIGEAFRQHTCHASKVMNKTDNSRALEVCKASARRLDARSANVAVTADVPENQSQPLRLKTRTVIVLLVVSNVLGNFALSCGLHEVGRLTSFSPWPYIQAFLNPLVAVGVLLLIVWLISQLSVLSRVDLSYVLPFTSVSYVLTALIGEFILHEEISTERWIGIGLIGLGVSLVARTLPRTTPVLHKLGDRPCEGA